MPIIPCSTGLSPPKGTHLHRYVDKQASTVFQSVHAPYFGTHRQDMQGITNVEVTCCDGHTELAVKGDNGPNESSIADVKYDVSKDDLNHILGCPGFCSVDRYKTGCERMGGEWDDSSGLGSAKCKNIPNDNPTGSWEQVNTFVMPIPGTSTVKSMEGGPCCNATDEIAKGVGKVGSHRHQHPRTKRHVQFEERV